MDKLALQPWAAAQNSLQALVDIMRDGSVAKTTLLIPYPYTLEDAKWWTNEGAGTPRADYTSGNWAIFEGDTLVGGISLEEVVGGQAMFRKHVRSLGYYVAPTARGRGVATRAVAALLDRLRGSEVTRIEANIFSENKASSRVLVKCGFVEEGRAASYFCKDGQFHDVVLFAKC